MNRQRRPAIAAEVERRSHERRTGLGGDIKAARLRRSWTQAQLAERAGLDRSLVSRVERGVSPLDLDMLDRISVALGVPLTVSFARDPRMDVADAGHLGIQELVLRQGRRIGFEANFELPTKPAEPWRSVDVVLAHEGHHWMLCVECWNTIGDVGASARQSARKLAEMEELAIGRWGDEAKVGLVWVVRATARNRGLVARYPEVFASRFPGSSRGWLAALTVGAQPPSEPGLVWGDVASTRLFAWRRHAG